MYIRSITDAIKSVVPQTSFISRTYHNSNLLLTAPHGGGAKPFYIRDRTTGIRIRDTYTRRLSDILVSLFNDKPSAILADIHRSKVDLNRNLMEATDGDTRAKAIWHDWNDSIYNYKRNLLNTYNTGLMVDIHSHNNNDEFQLGYNLDVYNYNRLRNNKIASVGSTFSTLNNGYSEYDMIFGRYSLGNSMHLSGYDIFRPRPGGETYFNGGYNIETYAGGGLGAVQIECPVSILEYDLQGVAYALYNSIEIFIHEFVR